jgi:hypothetical protein
MECGLGSSASSWQVLFHNGAVRLQLLPPLTWPCLLLALACCHLGAKVACVELPFDYISSDSKGGVGGTCVLRGCVPKKLMVYASEYADDFKDSVGFG